MFCLTINVRLFGMVTTEIFNYDDYQKFLRGVPNNITTYISKIISKVSTNKKKLNIQDVRLKKLPQTEIDYYTVFSLVLKPNRQSESNETESNEYLDIQGDLSKYRIIIRD